MDDEAAYRDPERCARCGGRCCLIYLPAGCAADSAGASWWYLDFSDFFHGERGGYGVPPRFLPDSIGTAESPIAARESLKAAGIDPDACEYLGPAGCIIDWDRRPVQCRSHRCHQWRMEET